MKWNKSVKNVKYSSSFLILKDMSFYFGREENEMIIKNEILKEVIILYRYSIKEKCLNSISVNKVFNFFLET